jgi:hypothetical protein
VYSVKLEEMPALWTLCPLLMETDFLTWALVIGDLSAGVGAVAISASRKVRRVYANEAKRDAHTFLTINVGNNRGSGKVEVSSFCTKVWVPGSGAAEFLLSAFLSLDRRSCMSGQVRVKGSCFLL